MNEEKFRKLERDLEEFKRKEKKLLLRLKKKHISLFNFGNFLQIDCHLQINFIHFKSLVLALN